ncbi:hypothetical protein EHS25_008235 [Saitozyma podzolica]|uniref:Uncharacterized protein n=1 Tax=Saitozyma podzolica TaxID=1890683 RepID=A0A427YP05_9TREE|nr:hypothetical protein EHS25_008235 [Saitozyma podzolica]
MPPAPTVTQLKSLHNALTSASSRFTSYNFHQYFSRRVRETWAPVLSTLDPPVDLHPTEVGGGACPADNEWGGAGMEASAGGGGQPDGV